MDFAGRRADGTAVRVHPHHRKESNIVARNLSDWIYIIQPEKLKGGGKPEDLKKPLVLTALHRHGADHSMTQGVDPCIV